MFRTIEQPMTLKYKMASIPGPCHRMIKVNLRSIWFGVWAKIAFHNLHLIQHHIPFHTLTQIFHMLNIYMEFGTDYSKCSIVI